MFFIVILSAFYLRKSAIFLVMAFFCDRTGRSFDIVHSCDNYGWTR